MSLGSLVQKYGKFAVVGATGVGVNLVVFTAVLGGLSLERDLFNLSTFLHSPTRTGAVDPVRELLASAVAFGAATLWNFIFNDRWTFRPAAGRRFGLGSRVSLYYAVSLGSLAINEVVLYLLSFAISPLVSQMVGIVAGSVFGFTGNYRFTFAEVARPAAVARAPPPAADAAAVVPTRTDYAWRLPTGLSSAHTEVVAADPGPPALEGTDIPLVSAIPPGVTQSPGPAVRATILPAARPEGSMAPLPEPDGRIDNPDPRAREPR